MRSGWIHWYCTRHSVIHAAINPTHYIFIYVLPVHQTRVRRLSNRDVISHLHETRQLVRMEDCQMKLECLQTVNIISRQHSVTDAFRSFTAVEPM